MAFFESMFSPFNWYGFLIALAMMIGIISAYFLARTRGYHEDLVFWVAVICIPLAIVGARLYYVIFDDHGFDYWTPARIVGFEDGSFKLQGLAIFGGVLAAMLGSLIVWQVFRKKENPLDRITLLQMFDLFFIFILFGQGLGRWGNFANEEAYGNLVTNPARQWFPYAVNIDGLWYQATFFYESVANFIGCAIMLWLYMGKRKSFDGFVFMGYSLWYGVTRLIVEGMRSDSLMTRGVRVSQVVSVLFFITGLVILITHIVRAINEGKKIFIFVPKDRLNGEYLDFEKSRFALPKRVYETKKKKLDNNNK